MPLAVKAAVIPGSPFDGVDEGQKLIYAFGTIVPSGSYPAGGDVMDFTAMTGGGQIPTGYQPVPGSVNITSNSGGVGHSGFLYYYRPGSPGTAGNGKMQVLTTGSGNQQPLAEIAAGAYPAGVTADTIAWSAAFVRS